MSMRQPFLFIAEDDPDYQLLIAEILKDIEVDLNWSFYADGIYLLEKLQALPHEELPDTIILDLSMPRMNGFEVLEILKNNIAWKKIRVIIFSSSVNPDHVKKAHELQCDAYLVKSAYYKEMISSLKNIFSEQLLSLTQTPHY